MASEDSFDSLRAYSEVLRIRMVEEAIADQYPNQEMRCPVHLSIGQEAAAVGVCMALRDSDWAFSAHRSHAHYLAKGGDLGRMFAEIYGKETGCAGGRGGSMHLTDLGAGFVAATPIVGSTIPIAVGAALTAQLKKEDRVVVAFFGEAAIETGVLHESINFACVRQLPVVFACEDNQFSVFSPIEVRQPPNRSLSDVAAGHGIRTIYADGNNVEAVWSAAADASNHARAGSGPVFLELPTYRHRQHCGPDFDNELPYRSVAEVEAWLERDPLLIARELLADDDSAQDRLSAIESRTRAELDEAFAFAKDSPYGEMDAGSAGVYA